MGLSEPEEKELEAGPCAANNTIHDATQVINVTSSSTPRSIQAYKRRCIPSDNYDDATDGENIFRTSTATGQQNTKGGTLAGQITFGSDFLDLGRKG